MTRYALNDFDFDLRRAVAGPLWTTSGWSTVSPEPGTVCSVAGFFAPPYAAPGTRLGIGFEVAGRRIPDAGPAGMGARGLLLSGGTWRLDGIERHGTYHRRTEGELVSLRVSSTLTPLHGQAGYALRVRVHNRGDAPVPVRLLPELSGRAGQVPLGLWGWMPPEPSAGSPEALDMAVEDREKVVPAGAGAEFVLAVRVGETAAPGTPRQWAEHAEQRMRARVERALARVPVLRTDVPGLDGYYRRSLASGLVSLWDNPSFATVPFVATSGIDGGALCAYAWDTGGYAPHTLALMLGDGVVDLVEAMVKADLTEHYAIAPDGTGVGVAYAYSGWSLICLAAAAACHTGLSPHLVGRLHQVEAALSDRFPARGVLRDYGGHENLLEMRSTGWEHVVASPNAERAASLDTLADLAAATGAALPADGLRREADLIRRAVAEELWDPRAGWFRSRHPGGHDETVYSVQAFDALRAGACTPAMARELLRHLRDGAFLGRYGVSSVSAEDGRHYELGDVDWSGGGAYTGETPQLALTLWERGESALAWDVLSRVLWMGDHFPYYPQDHYCDRPGAQPTGRRANVVAGLTGAEALLVGLAGLRPGPDGGLALLPRPGLPGEVSLTGIGYRGHQVDVRVDASGWEAAVDGRAVRASGDGPVEALPPGAPLADAPGAGRG
ncbi:hypothetical protein [Streptomyces sp. TS71-3]|uniref:MGH1-like glycoside hydrolase domain-containing protein n=1 Tax=Streptomyces sp. TS71-3 TaxID=2733862 RepID=UPI001B0B5546|nr:hypothetical protein [Streptomyces sp. TS71-3]GHJ41346.1 hypothetical protein Sm713_69550 [Streptomyces sp. TS71-3]